MKITAEFRLIALIVYLISAMTLEFIAAFKTTLSDKRVLDEMILDQAHRIQDFSSLAEDYVINDQRKSLLKLKQESDRISKDLSIMSEGGMVSWVDEEIDTYWFLDDEELMNALSAYQLRFEEHHQKINIIWESSLVSSNRTNQSRQRNNGDSSVEEGIIVSNQSSLEFLTRTNAALVSRTHTFRKAVIANGEWSRTKTLIFQLVLFIITGVILFSEGYYWRKNFLNKVYKARKTLDDLLLKDFEEGKDNVTVITENVHDLNDHMLEAETFIKRLGREQFSQQVSQELGTLSLGKSLMETSKKLNRLAQEEERNQWKTEGIAKVSEVLSVAYDNLQDLTFGFLNFMIHYLDLNQGAIYTIEGGEDGEDKHISMQSKFAYAKRKMVNKPLELGEGMTGQVVTDRQRIYLEDVPDGYVDITSGLGEATPNALLLEPVLHNDEILGVMEVASFKTISKSEFEFIEDACERLGASISAFKMNDHTRRLLDQSVKFNQELQFKEKEMKENTAMLEETQQELNLKLHELEKESNLIRNIVDAINKTSATIEMDMEGNILEMNEIYLNVLGYTLEEVIGKHESMFLTEDERDSLKYSLMWDSIRSGSFISGEYKRISKQGNDVWLNGNYNPIFDVDGKPFKVIKFAQFTTEVKERELDFNTKLNSFGYAFPVLELDLKAQIKTANNTYVNKMGFKRKEYRNVPLPEFLLDKQEVKKFRGVFRSVSKGAGEEVVLKYETKTGALKYFNTKLVPIKTINNDVHKVFCILEDVTSDKILNERLASELENANLTIQEYKEHESFYQQVHFSLELDVLGGVTKIDPQLLAQLGISKEEFVIGKPFMNLIQVAYEEEAKVLVEEIEQMKVRRGVVALQKNNGSILWGDVSVGTIFNEDEKPVKQFVSILDVTDNQVLDKETEQIIIQAKKQGLNQENGSETMEHTLSSILDWIGRGGSLIKAIDRDIEIPVFLLNHEYNIAHANKHVEDQVKDENVFSVFTFAQEDEKASFKNDISQGNLVQYDVMWKHKNYHMMAIPLFKELEGVSTLMLIKPSIE